MSPSATPTGRRLFGLLILFGVLTLVYTYPLWTQPDTVLNELYDVRLNTWIMAWDAHALVSDATLFDANIFYPHGNTLAFSENLLGNAIPVAPLNWAGHPILAYNVVLLTAFVLGGVGFALWIRAVTGSLAAGILGGVAWVFAPSRADHFPQIQLLTAQWIPFTLLAMHRYVETRRRRYASLAGGLLAWQYACGIQLTLLMLPVIAIYGVGLLLHAPEGRRPWSRRQLVDVLLAAAVFLAVAVPISVPYLQASDAEGFHRSLEETRSYSAQPKSLLTPSPVNRTAHMRALHETYRVTEGNHGLGLVVGMLLLLGTPWLLWRAASGARGRDREGVPRAGPRRRPVGQWILRLAAALTVTAAIVFVAALLLAQSWDPPPAWESLLGSLAATHPTTWLAVAAGIALLSWRPPEGTSQSLALVPALAYGALLSFLLALGPEPTAWNAALGTGPFRLLYDWLEPYRSIRAVGRFGLASSLCFSALAAIFVARLTRSRRRGPALTVVVPLVLAGLVFLEYRVWPLPADDARPRDESLYRALDGLPGRDAVLHLPMIPGGLEANITAYQLGSTLHWKALVNGYSGFRPPDIGDLYLIEPLSPEFLQRAREFFAVDYLVLHRRWLSEARYEELRRRAAEEASLEPVFTDASGTILRAGPVTERASRVYRRFRADRLADTVALGFEARTPEPDPVELEVIVNEQIVEVVRLTRRWERFEVAVQPPVESLPDGSVRLAFRTRSPPIPDPGRSLAEAQVLVNAHGTERSLAIDDRWLIDEYVEPVLAVRLAAGGFPIHERHALGTGPRTTAALRSLIRRAGPGEIVAIAVRTQPGVIAERLELRDFLAGLGVPDDLLELRAVALLLRPTTGEVLFDAHRRHATVRAGPPNSAFPRMVFRDLELVPAGSP